MSRLDAVIRDLPAWVRAGELGVVSYRVGSHADGKDVIRLAIDLESELRREAAHARFAQWELTNHSKLPFKLHWNTFVLPIERMSRDRFFARTSVNLETILGAPGISDAAALPTESGRIQLSF